MKNKIIIIILLVLFFLSTTLNAIIHASNVDVQHPNIIMEGYENKLSNTNNTNSAQENADKGIATISRDKIIQNLQDISEQKPRNTKTALVIVIVTITVAIIIVLISWWYKTNW